MIALRRAFLSIGMMLFFAGPATAEEPLSGQRLDIRAQPIGSALNEFAKQTGLQVFLSSDDAAGHVTLPLSGTFTPQAALDRLLTNTGLSYQFLNEKTVAVRTKTSDLEKTGNVSGEQEGSAQPVDEIHVAQSATASPSQADDKAEAKQESAESGDKGASREISEIIVTAQKRAERLHDVPISISVLSGESLDQSTVQGISEALNSVPGVSTTVSAQGGGTQIAIRGVTAGGPGGSGSSPVAYYLDSVPFGMVKHAFGPDANAYDMERVEVLRGPQGTLYGASAQNGVVRILTKDADLDRVEFKARTGTSNTQNGGGNYRGDMAVNVPIVPGKLAARAVGGYETLSGWIDKPNGRNVNDGIVRTLRLKLNGRANERLSAGLSAWVSHSDFGAPPVGRAGDFTTALPDEPMLTDYEVYGFKVGYESPAFSLTSMTGYLDFKNDGIRDYASTLGLADTTIQTTFRSKLRSQEVNLSSTSSGSWRWSAGASYRDVDDRLYQNRRQYVQPTDFNDTSESAAVFGELARRFFDRLELSAGLRYFEDRVVHQEFSRGAGVVVTPAQLIRRDARFHKLSPRVVLTWRPSEQTTAYTSYSEGFRSGFPQNGNIIANAPQFAPLEADNLKNYEIGVKSSFWGGRGSVDAAAFYIDWQDVQQTLTVNVGTIANPVPVSALVNGESASGPGFEFAVAIEPLERLKLGVNFNWSGLEVDSSIISETQIGLVRLFAKGDRLQYSPEYIAGVSTEYSFPLGANGYTGRLMASANYTSKQETRTLFANALAYGASDDVLMCRTSFALESPHRWRASVFADNLSGEDGFLVRMGIGNGNWDQRIRPRTVGVQLEYRFGR